MAYMRQRRVCPTRATVSRALEAAAAAAAAAARVGRERGGSASARSGGQSGSRAVEVFLSHRGADTKRSLAGLLYDRLAHMGVRPFLDSRSMEPGDRLYERIDAGIRECRVGVAIFSPRYCESVFCLHELAEMVEARKKLIPVFCDVKPSEMVVLDEAAHSPEDLGRYARALQEAKHTVGLTFDSKNGNWSELVTTTANVVLKCIREGREAHGVDQEI